MFADLRRRAESFIDLLLPRASGQETRVERNNERICEREHGYLPVWRTRTMQRLVRVSLTRTGIVLSREVLGTEEVPEHVMISLGCLGDCGGWRSAFAPFIDAQRAAAVSG